MHAPYRRIKVADLLSDTSARGKAIRKMTQLRSDVFGVCCAYRGCDRKFATHDACVAHQKRSHAAPTMYGCAQCHATFSTAPNRNKHVSARLCPAAGRRPAKQRDFFFVDLTRYVTLCRCEACTRRWSRSSAMSAVWLLDFEMDCNAMFRWFTFNSVRTHAWYVSSGLRRSRILPVILWHFIPTCTRVPTFWECRRRHSRNFSIVELESSFGDSSR